MEGQNHGTTETGELKMVKTWEEFLKQEAKQLLILVSIY